MFLKISLIVITTILMYGCCCRAADFTRNRLLSNGADCKISDKKYAIYVLGVPFAAAWAVIAVYIYDRCFTAIGFLQIFVVTCAAFASAIIDFKLKIIPNIISVLLLASGTVFHIISLFLAARAGALYGKAMEILIYNFVSMLAIAVFLLVAAKIAGGMGAGDIKLLSSMCYVGGVLSVLSTLSVALLIGAVCSIIFVISKKKSFKDDIAFAPFIAIGNVIAIILGLV